MVKILSKGKKINTLYFSENELPKVSILIAAHNEEKVIRQKIESILKNDYPQHLFEIIVGSDCSTDDTNNTLKKNSNVKLIEFNERIGKSGVINHLAEVATGEIFILTDANVFFDVLTIRHLIRHFKNSEIGLVGANIINTNIKKTGISEQEKGYLNWEKNIKKAEGLLWGNMMGAFGGCFAIRKSLYKKIPQKFIVDDFYLTMNVLRDGKKAIFDENAICHEDVSDKISAEFRRKSRISTGNFQNIFEFKGMLFKSVSISFSFISHKILRWKTPFFLILIFASSIVLGCIYKITFYNTMLWIESVVLVILPLEWLFRNVGLHIPALRYVSHFVYMNAAILVGFWNFVFKNHNHRWQPTERNQ